MSMKRVNFHLTRQQIEFLHDESERTGLKVAEIIRRCIDGYSNEYIKEDNTKTLKGTV